MTAEREFVGWELHSALSSIIGDSTPAVLIDKERYGFTYHKWREERAHFLAIVSADTLDDLSTRLENIKTQSISLDDIEEGVVGFQWLQVYKCHASKWRPVSKKKTWAYTSKVQVNSIVRLLKKT
jgi:hypothetical protein